MSIESEGRIDLYRSGRHLSKTFLVLGPGAAEETAAWIEDVTETVNWFFSNHEIEMPILAFIGSSRKDNTDITCGWCIKGAQSCSQAVEKIYLYNHQITLSATPHIYLQLA